MRGFIAQIRLRQHAGQDRTHDGISPRNTGTDKRDPGWVRRDGCRKRDCQIRRSRPDNTTPDIGGKTLTGTAQMDRKDQRDVVAPEAELADNQHASDKDSDLDHHERICLQRTADPHKQSRYDKQGWDLEDAKQIPATDDPDRQNGQQRAS